MPQSWAASTLPAPISANFSPVRSGVSCSLGSGHIDHAPQQRGVTHAHLSTDPKRLTHISHHPYSMPHMATSAICLRQQLQKFSFDLRPLLFVYPLKQDMLKSITGGRLSLLIWILEKTDAAKPFRGRKLVTRVWAPEAPALDSKPDCLWDARQALASLSSHQEHRPIGS